jgi:hypothetical protein
MLYQQKVLGFIAGYCMVNGMFYALSQLNVRSKASQTAGGRPSAGSYTFNPKIEIILPRPGIVT